MAKFVEDAGGKGMEDAASKFDSEVEIRDYKTIIEGLRQANVGRSILLG
ncbi:hypothetical protein [Halobacterium rubrum]|nr:MULTISPECIES: hypothetical protein [Halobacterium]MDH5020175.1 hypothetical protein [Halobacterium rubrum]